MLELLLIRDPHKDCMCLCNKNQCIVVYKWSIEHKNLNKLQYLQKLWDSLQTEVMFVIVICAGFLMQSCTSGKPQIEKEIYQE